MFTPAPAKQPDQRGIWSSLGLEQGALSWVPRQWAVVGLGGNLGDVRARLQLALAGLDALPATRLVRVSSAYQTRPFEASGPDYLNAVALLHSALGPQELLASLLALELEHDRKRPYHHAPRTLDLDLLAYGGTTRRSRSLILPHPRLTQRAFVLEPLRDLLDSEGASQWSGVLPELPSQAVCQNLAEMQGVVRLGGTLWP